MQSAYRYPDPGDRLTAANIRAVGVDESELRRQEAVVLDRFADRLAAQFPRRRLLDYGSGEGRLSFHFAALFEWVTAYEPDERRRASHAQRAGDEHREVELLASFDAAAVADTFDAAVCSHVIQHIARDAADAVLADLAVALRKGGELLLLTTFSGVTRWLDEPRYVVSELSPDGNASESEVDAVGFDIACQRNTIGRLPIHFWGRRELLGSLERHGFQTVEGYTLHGNAGVVGVINTIGATALHESSVAGPGKACLHSRDIAILATC
jgi:SAM-dependent methyltransferase